MKPPRVPLLEFPDVVIHAEELAVKKHPQFDAAKGADINAADRLAQDLNCAGCVEPILWTTLEQVDFIVLRIKRILTAMSLPENNVFSSTISLARAALWPISPASFAPVAVRYSGQPS